VSGWNILGIAGQDLYWIGGSGSWNDALHWSLSSGGAPYGCIPTTNDNVFFDANSFSASGQSVDISVDAYCKNMDWTGASNSPALSGWSTLSINGSLKYIPAMTSTYFGTLKFIANSGIHTIKSAGITLGGFELNGAATYELMDNLSVNWYGINFNNGTFNTNNFDINISGDFASNSSNVRTLNLGSSKLNISNWNMNNSTNLIFNAGTSEIIMTNNSYLFNGGNLDYNYVEMKSATWGSLNLNGSNTFNTLVFDFPSSIMLESGETQTTLNFIASGSQGNVATI
jgi:uncharacterized protein with beta-barrel porin domain